MRTSERFGYSVLPYVTSDIAASTPTNDSDKGTKVKRARQVPIIEEVRPMVIERLDSAAGPDARLLPGPGGGRISSAAVAGRDEPQRRFSSSVRSSM